MALTPIPETRRFETPEPVGNIVTIWHQAWFVVEDELPSLSPGQKTAIGGQIFYNTGAFGPYKRWTLHVIMTSDPSTTFSVFWRSAFQDGEDVLALDLDPHFWTGINSVDPLAGQEFKSYTSTDENQVEATEGTTFSSLGVLTAPWLSFGIHNTGATELDLTAIVFIGELV